MASLETISVEVYNKNVEPSKQPRILKLYREEDIWVVEMLTPEINTISLNADNVSVDFNTTLYNPYAIRDNYSSNITSLQGILAYKPLKTVESTSHYSKKITSAKEIYFAKHHNTDGSVSGVNVTFSKNGVFNTVDFKKSKDITEFSVNIFDSSGNHKYSNSYTENTTIDISDFNLSDMSIDMYISFIGFESEEVYVDDVTESTDWEIVNSAIKSDGDILLKAFINNPKQSSTESPTVLIKWETSIDGVSWINCEQYRDVAHTVVAYASNVSSDVSSEETLVWEKELYSFLNTNSFNDRKFLSVAYRSDCIIVSPPVVDTQMYRCTLIRTKNPPTDREGFPEDASYCVDYVLGQHIFYLKRNVSETFYNTLKNPTIGDMLYWKHALYSISPEFKNNIYASNPDSAIFPVSRIIDLGTFEGNTVRKLIPWRDYLIAFTDSTVHLIQEQELGFTSKVINTFVGTPERDANTCVATLNGIVFKSGSKLYSIVPNFNSGDETIFNISEISKPIEHILNSLEYNKEYNPFAFTTAEAYYLFIPGKVDTFCLKYNYTLRVWTQFKYPVLLYKHEMLSVNDIRVFAKKDYEIIEYEFEKEPSDTYELQTYGDFLTTEKDENDMYVTTPIEFFIDSGQKTDNLSLTKQFVESKIIVATLSDKDNFEMDVQIAIEGNTFNRHVDLNTDGALLRSDTDQILTLGTSSNITDSENTLNTMRQMFLRYSGKGKTIRHLIKGSSLYKFKIYETFYRYKILNVKQ